MQAHWTAHHASDDAAVDASEDIENENATENEQAQVTTIQPHKKSKITEHFDHGFTTEEKAKATRKLTFAAICNGWSFHSLQQTHFQAFCRALLFAQCTG